MLNTDVAQQPNSVLPIQKQATTIEWRPPQEFFVKVNSDAAFEQSTGKGFTGIICRDNQGKFLTASSSRFFANSPLVAEAISLREAVSLAVNLNLQQVIFESDNQTLIEVCNRNTVRKEIEGIIEDIFSLRTEFHNSIFTRTKREGNYCAHVIASLARDNLLHGSWLLRPPPLLRRALVTDMQALWK